MLRICSCFRPRDITWHEDNWDNPDSRFLAWTLHDHKDGGSGDIYIAFNAHGFQVMEMLSDVFHVFHLVLQACQLATACVRCRLAACCLLASSMNACCSLFTASVCWCLLCVQCLTSTWLPGGADILACITVCLILHCAELPACFFSGWAQ
jgi:hypothetical protein